MKDRKLFLLIGLLTVAGLFLVGVIVFTCYLYAPPGRRVFGQLDSPDGLFSVGGSSGGPIDGWGYQLYWKRPKELWAGFYLDHDSGRWTNLRLTYAGGVLSIDGIDRSLFEAHPIVRNFKIVDGRLFSVSNGQVMDHEFEPVCVYEGDPSAEDRGGRAMDESFPDWPNVWPKLKKSERDVVWSVPGGKR